MNDKVNQGLLRMLRKQKATQENQEDQTRAWDLAMAGARGAAWLQNARVAAACAADITAKGTTVPLAKNPLLKTQLSRMAAAGFKRYGAALLNEATYHTMEVTSIVAKANAGAFIGIAGATALATGLLDNEFLTRYKEAITHAAEDHEHAAEKAAAVGFEPA